MQCLLLSHPQTRNSGDYLHRVVWPGEALGEYLSVVAIQITHPNALKLAVSVELLIINMIVDPLILDVIHARKRKNLKTIYEISDDFMSFPKSLPMYNFYNHKPNQDLVKQLASSADAIQFSSQFLQEKYQSLNSTNIVFRNHLPKLDYAINDKHTGELDNNDEPKRLSLGWAGSLGHHEDAKKLANILKQWPAHEKVDVHIMAPDTILDLFKDVDLDIETTPTGDMVDYLNFLKGIDIGIAMLGNEDFNQGRSDGKYLEYASCGVVPVCSNLGSYKQSISDGKNGFLFDDSQDLYSKLDQLIDLPSLRDKVKSTAWEDVTNTRVHHIAVKSRLKFYRSFLKPYVHSANSYFNHAVPQKGYTELVDPVEGILLIALEQHAYSDFETAVELYNMVIERAPNFYLPWQRIGELYTQVNMPEDGESYTNTAKRLVTPTLMN